jgi:hypothetical protein
MFAEGSVHIPFSLSLSVVDQRAHDEYRYRCGSDSYIPPPKLCINRISMHYFVIMSFSRLNPRRTPLPMFYQEWVHPDGIKARTAYRNCSRHFPSSADVQVALMVCPRVPKE